MTAELLSCYLAVAQCAGVKAPHPRPRVEIVADEPHEGIGSGHGFRCAEYCLDPPVCEETEIAYCAGLTRGRTIKVSTATTAALPHEFLHYIIARRPKLRRGLGTDRSDSSHRSPLFTPCGDQALQTLPACAAALGDE